jgi:hypothetical protein
MKLVDVARMAHEANAALCRAIGDTSQQSWFNAPDWQRDSALNGVALHVENPLMEPEQSHASWLAQKAAEGWSFGETKDPVARTHPCFRPYAELDPMQRAKDHVFKSIVNTMSDFLDADEKALAPGIAQAFRAKVAASGSGQTAAEPQPVAAEAAQA